MPRIFDNLTHESTLLHTLREAAAQCHRADFCVGYFNLRGWGSVSDEVEKWPGGEGHCCRVLVGMMKMPEDERVARLGRDNDPESYGAEGVRASSFGSKGLGIDGCQQRFQMARAVKDAQHFDGVRRDSVEDQIVTHGKLRRPGLNS